MNISLKMIKYFLLLITIFISPISKGDQAASQFDNSVATIFLISCFQQKFDKPKFMELMAEPLLSLSYKGIRRIPNGNNKYINANVWSMIRSGNEANIILDESEKCSVATSDLEQKEKFLQLFETKLRSYIENNKMKISKKNSYPDNGFGITQEFLITREEGEQNIMLTVSTSEKNIIDAVISTY